MYSHTHIMFTNLYICLIELSGFQFYFIAARVTYIHTTFMYLLLSERIFSIVRTYAKRSKKKSFGGKADEKGILYNSVIYVHGERIDIFLNCISNRKIKFS